MEDTLVAYGSEIKAIDETPDAVKFAGWLVVFNTHDISPLHDKFTKSTDYDIEDGDPCTIYYDHGLNGTIKAAKLGKGKMFIKDAGIWFEGEVQKRKDYLKEHGDKIIDGLKQSLMSLSSGVPAHLVERKAVDGGHEVLKWPLGKDASITMTPAEPNALCVSLKSFADSIKATWSGAKQDDLPDSSFAYIEPGGTKVDGKTEPRSLRHFPYKDADGKPDADHVRDALSRIPQSDVSDEAKTEALKKVHAAAKELGIETEAATTDEPKKSIDANTSPSFKVTWGDGTHSIDVAGDGTTVTTTGNTLSVTSPGPGDSRKSLALADILPLIEQFHPSSADEVKRAHEAISRTRMPIAWQIETARTPLDAALDRVRQLATDHISSTKSGAVLSQTNTTALCEHRAAAAKIRDDADELHQAITATLERCGHGTTNRGTTTAGVMTHPAYPATVDFGGGGDGKSANFDDEVEALELATMQQALKLTRLRLVA